MARISTGRQVVLWLAALFLAGVVDGLAMVVGTPDWSNPFIIIAFTWGFHSLLIRRETTW